MRLDMMKVRKLASVLAVALALGSCGSSTNNDQGVSFSLLGFARTADDCGGDSGDVTFLTGLSINLSDLDTGESGTAGGSTAAALVLQNNLTAQFIRTDRVFYEYAVAGASVEPPSTSSGLTVTLGPVSTTEGK